MNKFKLTSFKKNQFASAILDCCAFRHFPKDKFKRQNIAGYKKINLLWVVLAEDLAGGGAGPPRPNHHYYY